MANSWYRVAEGLRKVCGAAARQGGDDMAVVVSRTAQHLAELASRASNSAFHSDRRSYEQPSVPPNASNNDSRDHLHSSQPDGVPTQSTQGNDISVPESLSGTDEDLSTMRSQQEIQIEEPHSSPKTVFRPLHTVKDTSVTDANRIKESTDDRSLNMNAFSLSSMQKKSAPPNDTAYRSSVLVSAAPSIETINHIQEGQPVPSTRFGRAFGFARLGVGLAAGTVMEGASRLLGGTSTGSLVINDGNSDRLAANLCRMRGAAMKMGQMLSIQDESLLPPSLSRALQQVRQGAEAMPAYQLNAQLESELGKEWRQKFIRFDKLPFAAASIGQVHRASIQTSSGEQQVVVKVQYPGVGESIESDLRNLSMLVKWSGFAPKGLFIENVIRVGRDELKVECDYIREMQNQQRIRELVESDPVLAENKFYVPSVVSDLTTDQVITSEYLSGGTIDKIANTACQEEKNRIGRTILYLTMKELFDWRFMQTDPNWGNFLYDVGTQRTGLIDFGAAREYTKSFVDGYLRVVWASANKDETTLMNQSHSMGFLTGEENDQMKRAHILSGFTVGEPFHDDAPFDFKGSSISERMGEHTSVFLRHRLTPPPEEVYTLHRKLAGAYMLCIKLGAVVSARDMLHDIVKNHKFEDGLEPPST